MLLLLVSTAAGAHGTAGTGARAAERPTVRRIDRWRPQIAEASVRFGIPENWIRQVMSLESGGWTRLEGRPITSRAGAMGLMQLMPGTWAEMRELHGLGRDPYDPRDNILAGTAYLRAMYDRFGYPGLFAAYNAGPSRYADHLASGRRLPAETVAYISAARLNVPRSAAPLWGQSSADGIFVTLGNPRSRDVEPLSASMVSDTLFIRLTSDSTTSK